MAEWKTSRVSSVWATTDPLFAWVRLADDNDTWRRIEPRSADGVSNVFQIATGAWVRDHDLVLYMLNDAGQIISMSPFLVI
jgi:hypothetical protein